MQIVSRIIRVSGRRDLSGNEDLILNWLDDYKLKLQREKRYFVAEKTDTIQITANNRTTDLPDDFLFPIILRRPHAGLIGIQTDLNGQTFQVTKKVNLTRWLVREDFLTRFPIQMEDGNPNVGAVNDYILENDKIIWGPIPGETETIYIDYFGKLPEYSNPVNLVDAFTKWYPDGLFYKGMQEVFEQWIPDAGKSTKWEKRSLQAELSLYKYQIGREMPMESTLELPDN